MRGGAGSDRTLRLAAVHLERNDASSTRALGFAARRVDGEIGATRWERLLPGSVPSRAAREEASSSNAPRARA